MFMEVSCEESSEVVITAVCSMVERVSETTPVDMLSVATLRNPRPSWARPHDIESPLPRSTNTLGSGTGKPSEQRVHTPSTLARTGGSGQPQKAKPTICSIGQLSSSAEKVLTNSMPSEQVIVVTRSGAKSPRSMVASRNVGVKPFVHGVQQLVPQVEAWSVRPVVMWSGDDDEIFLVWIDFTFSARMSKAVGSALAMTDNARGTTSTNKVREFVFMIYLDLLIKFLYRQC